MTSSNPSLPESLAAWRSIHPFEDAQWFLPWLQLRPFFFERGYDLYRPEAHAGWSRPNSQSPAAQDSFGLYGIRDSNYVSSFPKFAVVFPARDRLGRDVVIKAISKGAEGADELEILRFLNTEPLKSDPHNATVPVEDYLTFEDWKFAVMPMCDGSDELPVRDASEAFEIMEQILSALAFLHEHHIAHLDVSHENVMINHHGHIPRRVFDWSPDNEPNHFRTTFPIRYLLIDFGLSARFNASMPLSECQTDPTPKGRAHRAPEASKARYNPFSADAYQVARMFYSWFYNVVFYVPDLLKLLQDMTVEDPALRPTVQTALERFREIRASLGPEGMNTILEMEAGVSYPEVIRDDPCLPPFPPRPYDDL